jgi:hypothetical protein
MNIFNMKKLNYPVEWYRTEKSYNSLAKGEDTN